MSEYTVREVNPQDNLARRFFIERDGTPISPWHDIPLYADEGHQILNMVVEIPRWTNAKFEVGSHSQRSIALCWSFNKYKERFD